ncbi:purine catabolism protein PurC [Sulfobacillus sp. hq2]|nr:purine catabolism protein PurC [Sulfobacillus sp. hq2]
MRGEALMVVLRDVLKRQPFADATVIAGHTGVNRPVKWVHIGEIPNIGEFLRGGELVLSTGVGLSTEEQRRTFVLGLVKAQASGVVIELGAYFTQIPQDLIDLANAHDLPVIVFSHLVRFLDLSQEVNSLLISQHHRILEDLDALSGRLRKVLLSTEGLTALFEASFDVLKRPLAYLSRATDDKVQLGDWPFALVPVRQNALHPLVESSPAPYLRQTISVFGQPVGDVAILLSTNYVDEYLYLALDRITTAAAQEIIRMDTLEKRKRQEEAVLLEQLFFAEHPSETLLQRCRSRYNLTSTRRYRVCVVPNDSAAPKAHAAIQRLSALLATALLSQTDRDIWLITGREGDITNLPQLLGTYLGERPNHIGLSAPYRDPAQMHQAFSEAYDAAQVASHLDSTRPQCYEKLGAYRWILATPPDVLRRLVIHPELGPLLQPEHGKETEGLLQTLEALLTFNGSKQEVSQWLGIHRQTLYARIRALKSLLGHDFLVFERRVAIENALLAYRFLCSQGEMPSRAAPPSS